MKKIKLCMECCKYTLCTACSPLCDPIQEAGENPFEPSNVSYLLCRMEKFNLNIIFYINNDIYNVNIDCKCDPIINQVSV